MNIHNIYNPSPTSQSSQEQGTLALLRKVLESTVESRNHIILGDLNLHHPLWGGNERPIQHKAADLLIKLAQDADLELVTTRGEPTWRARGTQSTIDLTFLS